MAVILAASSSTSAESLIQCLLSPAFLPAAPGDAAAGSSSAEVARWHALLADALHQLELLDLDSLTLDQKESLSSALARWDVRGGAQEDEETLDGWLVPVPCRSVIQSKSVFNLS